MKPLTVAAIAISASQLAACALFPADRWPETAGTPATAEGFDADVFATVALVKRSGHVDRLARHAISLPTRTVNSIVRYDLEFPESCGGYRFGVYESDDNQILEYRHMTAGGADVVVRDYVSGDNPFIAPGLWTSYDHVDGEVTAMMADLARSQSPLLQFTYSRGLVTSLYETAQQELDQAYRQAVQAVAHCAV